MNGKISIAMVATLLAGLAYVFGAVMAPAFSGDSTRPVPAPGRNSAVDAAHAAALDKLMQRLARLEKQLFAVAVPNSADPTAAATAEHLRLLQEQIQQLREQLANGQPVGQPGGETKPPGSPNGAVTLTPTQLQALVAEQLAAIEQRKLAEKLRKIDEHVAKCSDTNRAQLREAYANAMQVLTVELNLSGSQVAALNGALDWRLSQVIATYEDSMRVGLEAQLNSWDVSIDGLSPAFQARYEDIARRQAEAAARFDADLTSILTPEQIEKYQQNPMFSWIDGLGDLGMRCIEPASAYKGETYAPNTGCMIFDNRANEPAPSSAEQGAILEALNAVDRRITEATPFACTGE